MSVVCDYELYISPFSFRGERKCHRVRVLNYHQQPIAIVNFVLNYSKWFLRLPLIPCRWIPLFNHFVNIFSDSKDAGFKDSRSRCLRLLPIRKVDGACLTTSVNSLICWASASETRIEWLTATRYRSKNIFIVLAGEQVSEINNNIILWINWL